MLFCKDEFVRRYFETDASDCADFNMVKIESRPQTKDIRLSRRVSILLWSRQKRLVYSWRYRMTRLHKYLFW